MQEYQYRPHSITPHQTRSKTNAIETQQTHLVRHEQKLNCLPKKKAEGWFILLAHANGTREKSDRFEQFQPSAYGGSP